MQPIPKFGEDMAVETIGPMNQEDSNTSVPDINDEEEDRTIILRETNPTNPWAVIAFVILALGLVAVLVGWKTGAIRFEKPSPAQVQTSVVETAAPPGRATPAVGNREMTDEERLRRLFERLKATLEVLQQS